MLIYTKSRTLNIQPLNSLLIVFERPHFDDSDWESLLKDLQSQLFLDEPVHLGQNYSLHYLGNISSYLLC